MQGKVHTTAHQRTGERLVVTGTKGAAVAMNVQPDTVREWIRQGAPVVRQGANGPGRGALVDVDALRRWRGRKGEDAPLVAIDAELLARGVLAVYKAGAHRALGIGNQKAAALLLQSWAFTVREATGHPPSTPWPHQIAVLSAIAASSR